MADAQAQAVKVEVEKITVEIERLQASAPPQAKPDYDKLKQLVKALGEKLQATPTV